MESDEDIMKLLEHGQRLAAENNGIVIALEMLQIINYYSNIMQRDKLDPLISEIFDIMASRKLPSSQVLFLFHTLPLKYSENYFYR